MQSKYLEVEFGSIKIKFFPLTLGQMQDMEADMDALLNPGALDENGKRRDPFHPERLGKLTRLFHASAQRGDPAIDLQTVRNVIDVGNMLDISRTCLGQFGPPKPREPAPNGEADSGPTSPLNGGESTPA